MLVSGDTPLGCPISPLPIVGGTRPGLPALEKAALNTLNFPCPLEKAEPPALPAPLPAAPALSLMQEQGKADAKEQPYKM